MNDVPACTAMAAVDANMRPPIPAMSEVRAVFRNYVRRDRDPKNCTDCGMCVSICPVKAHVVDPADHRVVFHLERHLACGTCLDVRSPGAYSRGRLSTRSD